MPSAGAGFFSNRRCVTECVAESVPTIHTIHTSDKRTPPDLGVCAGYSCHSQYSRGAVPLSYRDMRTGFLACTSRFWTTAGPMCDAMCDDQPYDSISDTFGGGQRTGLHVSEDALHGMSHALHGLVVCMTVDAVCCSFGGVSHLRLGGPEG